MNEMKLKQLTPLDARINKSLEYLQHHCPSQSGRITVYHHQYVSKSTRIRIWRIRKYKSYHISQFTLARIRAKISSFQLSHRLEKLFKAVAILAYADVLPQKRVVSFFSWTELIAMIRCDWGNEGHIGPEGLLLFQQNLPVPGNDGPNGLSRDIKLRHK